MKALACTALGRSFAEPGEPALAELQRWLQRLITTPVDDDSARDRALEQRLTRGPALDAKQRLELYRDAYRARLIECLRDDYPAVAAALGAAAFERVATEYINAHPSRSPSLNAYGKNFAGLVAGSELAHREFLSELARLEWAIVEAIHASPEAPIAASSLESIPAEGWAQVRLLPSDSLRVLVFDYPVPRYYQAFRSDEGTPTIPQPQPSAVAVYRRDDVVFRMGLKPVAARFLAALTRGETLDAACSELEAALTTRCDLTPAEVDVAGWLADWIGAGLFNELRTLTP